MRLHLVISRHGLPITRILWTTSANSAVEYGAHHPASTAAVASSRTPNIAFSNGGYTIAQLLEDVNEVVPLETEPQVFDAELSGQWGLEDYVVEVGGSECLHFMEVDGLLRDGDEVVIRALQLADLRTRRLCGRHQITTEGKHLIDGVAFGSPFLKRTTSTRPAITIPPRKKRRTVFSGWERGPDFAAEDTLDEPDEEGDGEWMPPPETGFGKELSIMPAEHEESMGTVIRHPIDHLGESESEDVSDMEEDENELESELQALKEDFEEPSQFVDIRNQARNASGHPLRAASIVKRPTSKGSLAAASSLSSKRSRADDSPRTSKAVRFNKGDEGVPELPQAEESVAESSGSDSDSAASSDSDSDSDSDDASSSEVEPAQEAASSDSDSDSDASSDSSDSSDSDSENEAPPAPKPQPPAVISAPGEGSIRTKKSNNRLKLRRRLSKLKELGALPDEADFDALRAWEAKNDGWFNPEQSISSEAPAKSEQPEQSSEKIAKQQKKDKKEQEQKEFEARRQKLLRDLASGNGVDVDETSEKENHPPRTSAVEPPAEQVPDEDQPEKESSKEASHRRTLDIASSRRMLFGSLGMRTPKTKEDEEETRRKLAAKASASGPQKRPSQVAQDADQMDEDEDESDGDSDWMNKLDVRAVECVYPEIELTAPPYPFVQRWDKEANALIREQKGPGKKRKRKQRIQVYHNEEEYDENGNWYGDDYYQGDDQNYYEAAIDPYYQGHYAGEAEGDGQLNYDEGPEPEQTANGVFDDLPLPPSDMGLVPDLSESELEVGAIIAFRQLDMSKATNWQPQMSEYRVAEVRSVKEQGVINVLLAKRDRKRPSANEDTELRQFSKFEVPDLANDEQEDDGYRELAFAELSDPKLLQSASGDQNTREGSIVSVVEESVPNAQPASEMELDETTFVTIGNEVSHLESTHDSPGVPDEVQKTPGPAAVPQIQVQVGSDQRSVTPPIPSPSFTGFHSARSWQQVTPGLNPEGNLEGHTLVGGETPSAVMNHDEGPSMLSYMSANQSFETEETPDQHERQVIETLAPPESGESGPQSGSLLSTINGDGASDSQPLKKEMKEKSNTAPISSSRSESWTDLLSRLRNGQADPDQLLVISDDESNADKESWVVSMTPDPGDNNADNQSSHSNSNFAKDKSGSKPPSPSPQPPKSTQKEPSNPPNTDGTHLVNFFSPAASTRSKQSQRARESVGQIPGSPILGSQASAAIDLTSSLAGSPEPEPISTSSAAFGTDKNSHRSGPSRASTGRFQRVEVSISPSQSQKSQKKRRTSRKF